MIHKNLEIHSIIKSFNKALYYFSINELILYLPLDIQTHRHEHTVYRAKPGSPLFANH